MNENERMLDLALADANDELRVLRLRVTQMQADLEALDKLAQESVSKDEALKMALEFNRENESHRTLAETRYWCNQYKLLAQQAIEALAQPAQEPVVFNTLASLKHKKTIGPIESAMSNTTPPQRPWVGLTDEEIRQFDVDPIEAKQMIAKLKEKHMTERDIELAKQAKLPVNHPDWADAARRFAKLIRADEREACAKVCEEQEDWGRHATPDTCAAAIRARGNT